MAARRPLPLFGLAVAGRAASPASAPFYLQNHAFEGATIRGDEPGILSQPMPGATEAETRAALVWNMRAALNVAALHCQFEPPLLTVPNYNAVLKDHDAEFDGAQTTLTKYFTRVNKTKPAGQKALDSFGTRTYSSFVTVGGQLGFCRTAASIGRDAVFTPRGQFGTLATERMQQLRASLLGSWGEQGYPRFILRQDLPRPQLDPQCWDKKGNWKGGKCGPAAWPKA